MKNQLDKAENKPGFAGNFALKDAVKVGSKYMKLYTEYEAMSKVKAFLLPMLEQAKLDEIREAPTMYVLDYARPAIKKISSKTLNYCCRNIYRCICSMLSILDYKNTNEKKLQHIIAVEKKSQEVGASI